MLKVGKMTADPGLYCRRWC